MKRNDGVETTALVLVLAVDPRLVGYAVAKLTEAGATPVLAVHYNDEHSLVHLAACVDAAYVAPLPRFGRAGADEDDAKAKLALFRRVAVHAPVTFFDPDNALAWVADRKRGSSTP